MQMNAKKKQTKYYPPYLKPLLIFVGGLFLLLIVWLTLYGLGYRYMKIEYENGDEALFVGRVDGEGTPISGKATFSGGEEISFRDGVLYRANGEFYEGGLKDLKYHGTGKLTLASGDTYSGTFENGEIVGKGVYTFASGYSNMKAFGYFIRPYF